MLAKEGNFEVIRANGQHGKSSFYNKGYVSLINYSI